MERTLAVIKPHVLCSYAADAHVVVVDIIGRYLDQGLTLTSIKILKYTEEMAREFYQEHWGKPFFPELLEATLMGNCIAMIWSGKNAIQKVREINGATNPLEALPGTIRHKYSVMRKGPLNAVHGSDSAESAEREIALIFG